MQTAVSESVFEGSLDASHAEIGGNVSPFGEQFEPIVKPGEAIGLPIGDDEDDISIPTQPKSAFRNALSLVARLIPAGSALAASVNLISTSLGAGIVGMPAGFGCTGIFMGIFYLICVSAETAYSMGLVVQASEITGCQTYEELARRLFHDKANYFVGAIRILNTLGGTVVFVVLIRDLSSPIVTGMSNVPEFFKGAVGLRIIQAILFLIFMLPLVIPRYINAMRYISAIGLTFILYLCIVIIVHCISDDFAGAGNTQVAVGGNIALKGLGIFIFAFMCQINCLEIYYELADRNIATFRWCCWISMFICGSVYIAAGLFGYLDFGATVNGSILLEYDPLKNVGILICYIGVFIKICASFSLLSFACRSALFPMFGWNPKTVVWYKHVLGSVALALINLILGIFVPNVSLAFSFVGGFCGGIIGFIMPALFIMYAGNWSLKTVGFLNWFFTYVVLCAGVVSIVFGTASAIYQAVA